MFLVRQNLPNVHPLSVEVNHSDDPVLVAAEVENMKYTDFVDRIKHIFYVGKVQERPGFTAKETERGRA